jgi:hypothetical protein
VIPPPKCKGPPAEGPQHDTKYRSREDTPTQQRAQPLRDDAQRFRVLHQRHSGAMREYGRYADRSEADRVAKLLRWAGAVATVEVAS